MSLGSQQKGLSAAQWTSDKRVGKQSVVIVIGEVQDIAILSKILVFLYVRTCNISAGMSLDTLHFCIIAISNRTCRGNSRRGSVARNDTFGQPQQPTSVPILT